jgi:hypothetical protein
LDPVIVAPPATGLKSKSPKLNTSAAVPLADKFHIVPVVVPGLETNTGTGVPAFKVKITVPFGIGVEVGVFVTVGVFVAVGVLVFVEV